MSPTPFTDGTLRDAFFSGLGGDDELPPRVALLGSGPFTRTDLARFVGRLGVEVVPASARTRTLVLGREGWSADALGRIVDERSGQVLEAFSQGMFLAFAATGSDPFGQGREVVERYGRGHPALQHLTTLGFDWPTRFVFQGRGELGAEEGPDVSPLRRLGYRLGDDAPSDYRRKELLTIAFTSPLPQVGSPQYMEKWGRPESERRLRRMADRISSAARAGGRAPDGGDAIREQARRDLTWLGEEFHRARFDFPWPGVDG